MGTIPADQILSRASALLVDKTQRRWTAEELLEWLNDGQLAIVQLRPDAYTAKRIAQLVQGTRQSVPSADLRLLDVPRNMGTNGTIPGRACTYVDRKQLDLSDPDWHSSAVSATVEHWAYDQAVPKTWWCYPPQPTSNRGQVELDVSAVPERMTIVGISGQTTTTPLTLDDIWLNPLLQFIVYRGYSKDAEYTVAGGKADIAWREFMQTMGLKTDSARRFDPSKNQPPRYDAPPKSDAQGAFGTP